LSARTRLIQSAVVGLYLGGFVITFLGSIFYIVDYVRGRDGLSVELFALPPLCIFMGYCFVSGMIRRLKHR
jgi:hypothetical protein